MRAYRRARNDMFRNNFYGTVLSLNIITDSADCSCCSYSTYNCCKVAFCLFPNFFSCCVMMCLRIFWIEHLINKVNIFTCCLTVADMLL